MKGNYLLNGGAYSYEKSVPGCLGKVASLFDLKSDLPKNKLLTNKPYHDGSNLARSLSDVSIVSSPVIAKEFGDKLMLSKMYKPSSMSIKSEGILMKMLITQEMTKDLESMEALDVLSYNHHLFLKLIQDPNSQTKVITVLKPSKMVVNGKQASKSSPKNRFNLSPVTYTQPTRIVVLKPTTGMAQDSMAIVPSITTSSPPTILSSETEFVDNLSDTEAIPSPGFKHSWDYINRNDSSYSCTSSVTRVSSVGREAKKRLSERWALMSANRTYEKTTTLGEMLALSDYKNSELVESHGSPLRSKSLPVEALCEEKMDGVIKRVAKSSLRGKVASLLFRRRSKKPCKVKIEKLESEDPHRMPSDYGYEIQSPSLNLWLKLNEEQSQSFTSQQVSWSTLKPTTLDSSAENQDQPSPISVLERKFEEDGRSNLIGKSPPIGSIARTLSWAESPPSGSHEEVTWLYLVQSLLSPTNMTKWHSLDSPLDPLLRESYVTLISQQPFYNEANQRRLKSNCWLIFDYVNATLVDEKRLESDLRAEKVWEGVKDWVLSCGWEVEGGGEENRVVAERLVKEELGGRGWENQVKIEVDIIGKEIEEKLMKELVEEFVGEWLLC